MVHEALARVLLVACLSAGGCTPAPPRPVPPQLPPQPAPAPIPAPAPAIVHAPLIDEDAMQARLGKMTAAQAGAKWGDPVETGVFEEGLMRVRFPLFPAFLLLWFDEPGILQRYKVEYVHKSPAG